MNDYEKQFAVVYPNAFDILGKRAAIHFEEDGQVWRTGLIRVHRVSDDRYVVQVDIYDPTPGSYREVFLSQAHIDSLSFEIPLPLAGCEVVVERAFLRRHCIPDTPNRQDAS